MDLNQLKTFYTLAQTKNYSNCAKRLFVTQSAVSHSIKKLETSIGHKLVEKSGSEFRLTKKGEILFFSCQKIFSELEATEDLINSEKTSIEFIRLGSPIEFGVSILIKNMSEFLRLHPRIHLDFQLGNFLFPDLLNDKLDILIDCKTHQHPDVRTITLFREEYVVIVSPQYLKRQNITEVVNLENCNIISMDKELTWWDNFIHALPLELNLRLTRITRINHVRGMINAVINSMGVGFVPKYTVLKELAEGSLVSLFPEIQLLEDHFRIYLKSHKSSSRKYSSLIQFIKQLNLT
ncbi:LysR family transcriptional regulator [bacterium]|nr:LysR family transcriptional regulator [bacterium]